MSGFVVERHGYTKASTMILDVIQDMIANGFVPKFVTGSDKAVFNKAELTDAYRVTLEAGGDVDPLNAAAVSEKQPWRVCFNVQDAQTVMVYTGTPLQLTDDGKVATVSSMTDGLVQSGQSTRTIKALVPYDVIGAIGAQVGTAWLTKSIASTQGSKSEEDIPALVTVDGKYSAPTWTAGISQGNSTGTPGDESVVDELTKGLVTRARRVVPLQQTSYPMTYRLVISPRGMWLGIWEDATTAETSATFNWFLIQRPVDRATGLVLTTGKAPVFCVNSVGPNIWQFTVRESDILRPGKRRSATVDEVDSECIINNVEQVSLSEDGKYIVTFPSRLNTSRYRYPHELDMIGLTSADVVSQFTDVPLTVYGETTGRVYKALHANGTANTGMRILVLQQGGGIS